MAKCPFCGAEISVPVRHSDECPSCNKVLHSCRCCSFYSPDAHFGCRETIDDPVWDKDKPNFCDYFRLTEKANSSSKDEERAQKSREALKNLFDF
ncbi:MAG: hypothetical protein II493_03015 [Spirochaetales bacterium]|nr:hypothetical protein [Spirochaetales bacterium]